MSHVRPLTTCTKSIPVCLRSLQRTKLHPQLASRTRASGSQCGVSSVAHSSHTVTRPAQAAAAVPDAPAAQGSRNQHEPISGSLRADRGGFRGLHGHRRPMQHLHRTLRCWRGCTQIEVPTLLPRDMLRRIRCPSPRRGPASVSQLQGRRLNCYAIYLYRRSNTKTRTSCTQHGIVSHRVPVLASAGGNCPNERCR